MGNICGSFAESHEASLYDQLPLAFNIAPGQNLAKIFVVLSLNILSQKLVGDELPSYYWKNSPETKNDLLNERLKLMTKFLDDVHKETKAIDIINLQEIGCDEDQELLNEAIGHLNKKNVGKYQICLAEKGTGAQGLKVGTIYDMNKYQLLRQKHLIFTKGGKETQYGMILDL